MNLRKSARRAVAGFPRPLHRACRGAWIAGVQMSAARRTRTPLQSGASLSYLMRELERQLACLVRVFLSDKSDVVEYYSGNSALNACALKHRALSASACQSAAEGSALVLLLGRIFWCVTAISDDGQRAITSQLVGFRHPRGPVPHRGFRCPSTRRTQEFFRTRRTAAASSTITDRAAATRRADCKEPGIRAPPRVECREFEGLFALSGGSHPIDRRAIRGAMDIRPNRPCGRT